MLLGAWARFGPLDERIADVRRFTAPTLLDRNGALLYEPLSAAGTRADAMRAEALPPLVVAATVAAEDHRFFRHPGVDPLAVARAAAHNLRARRVVEGGSTITQQTAKLLLGARTRSVAQKARETVVALRLEQRMAKREILALYLTVAPYGNRITGIERASRFYFGVPAARLTAAQAAFLAALPQRPEAFNPLRNPDAALPRQRRILRAMGAAQGEIRFARPHQELAAQHFVEQVLPLVPAGSGAVRTSLDLPLQREVRGIIDAHRPSLFKHGARAAAVVVLDNATGEWLAWEGSGDYFGETFGGAIDGVTAPRQPGSTLKPFTYAIAFESGSSPASVVDDAPTHFPTAEAGVVYTPRNYDGRFRGPMRIRAALAGSQNVPAVATLARVGPASLARVLRRAGATTLDRNAAHYGLGLTLGDAEMRLDELVVAYSAFARGGSAVQPSFLCSGRRLAGARPLFEERTAFWVADILSDRAAREWSFGEGGSLDFPFRVAVKTGTSQAYRDNWTVGFTREVTVGVWVGNFDREPLRHSSGVTGAAPIFNAVMLAAVKRLRGEVPVGDSTPVVAPPADVERIAICTLSGLRPSTWCPAVDHEWLAKESPAHFCGIHRAPRAATPAVQLANAATLRIDNPPDGATYMIDPTLRKAFQSLRFRASGAKRVTWRVDGKRSAGEWPLEPGTHTITAIDTDGARDEVRIYVK